MTLRERLHVANGQISGFDGLWGRKSGDVLIQLHTTYADWMIQH